MENDKQTNFDTKKVSFELILFIVVSALCIIGLTVGITSAIIYANDYESLDTYAYFTIDNQSYLLEIESYTKTSTTYELKFSDNSYLTISKDNCLIYRGVISD